MPVFEWKDDDMAHSLMFFPFVGAVIGAAIFAINALEPLAAIPVAVRIILTILIPLVVTGGFHVDGLMDTEDALNSYASREKKLEILSDPHIGAFSVISLIKWLLIYASSVTAILLNPKTDTGALIILGMTFVISRCLTGITSVVFKKARDSGMLHEETKNSRKGTVIFLTIILGAAFLLMAGVNVVYCAGVALVYLLHTYFYRRKVYREFGGVTGDTAGFYLTTGEVLSSAALAVLLYILP